MERGRGGMGWGGWFINCDCDCDEMRSTDGYGIDV
jgi:hypothetical protein